MNRTASQSLQRLALLCLLALGIVYRGAAQGGKKQLTVDEIFGSSTLQLKSLTSPQWVDGGKRFSYIETDSATKETNLWLYTVANGARDKIVDVSRLTAVYGERALTISSYEWSPDGRRILLSGSLPARAPKSGGNFGVFTLADSTFRLLTDTAAPQMNIKFSPDGSRIGFVRSNNLYVVDCGTGKETQLTSDGSDEILNGRFDWVYEEEFGIIDGWSWSPDGRRIAYWRLDQSVEPTFPLLWYSRDEANPKIEMTHYPKAGDRNAEVKIGVIDVDAKVTRWVNIGANPDMYIPRIRWTQNPDVLCVERLNRAQDTLDVLLADVAEGTVRTAFSETDTGWIGIRDDLTFLKRSNQFFWTSNRDGNNHIYLYDLDGTLVRQVTRGAWEVTKVVGVDERRDRIFFLATQASPLERQLYSIRFDGTGMRRLTREHGVHDVNFSPEMLLYLDTYSSVTQPTEVSLRTNEGALVADIVRNPPDFLKDYALGEHRFFTFRTSDSVMLNGWMIRPPGFTPGVRYPVLLYVYGGPGSQTVEDSWGGTTYLWHQMFAEHGYIVVSVDNRGTGARGKVFLQQTHLRLGLREVGDQIECARYLTALPFVDASRIGIWGWSFGGYMTCLAMTLGADYFKTGVAVAPVTSWRFYDTIYTERYMSTPGRNPEGYAETSPITYAAKLKGNLLVVHGTTDDNVHWQNTIVFVNELIRDNKQVQTMFYPGRNHGIYGDNATTHLRSLIEQYILEKL